MKNEKTAEVDGFLPVLLRTTRTFEHGTKIELAKLIINLVAKVANKIADTNNDLRLTQNQCDTCYET